MRPIAAALLLAGTAAAPTVLLAADATPKPPYWASIRAGQAMMRTGPGRAYPASWLYRRADLPVRVVATHRDARGNGQTQWRKVEDPAGVQGWMQANLLSGERTAMVRGSVPAAMLAAAAAGAKLMWRAAPGVIGRVSGCANGWCRLDVKGRAGFVEAGSLWGVEAGEVLP